MAPLVCPKCKGEMRSYERNQITIDQCEECRGIFLDRGELERLIEAESQRSPEASPQTPQPQYPQQQPGYGQPYPPQQAPRGFWENMFGEGQRRRGHHGGHH